MDLLSLIDTLSGEQREKLEKYANYHFGVIDEINKNSCLNRIYQIYTEDISNLISKCEVYNHDLPDGVLEINELVFSLLVYASQLHDSEKVDGIYYQIIKCEEYLVDVLRADLLNVYIDLNNTYRKFLKKYNYKGLHTETCKKADLDNARKKLRQLKKTKKESDKCIKSWQTKIDNASELNDLSVNLTSVRELTNLKTSMEEAEKMLGDLEKAFPEIVNNGYNGLRVTNIIKYGATGLSLFLAVTGVINLINFIFSLIQR